MKKRLCLIVATMFTVLSVMAQSEHLNLIPQPKQVKMLGNKRVEFKSNSIYIKSTIDKTLPEEGYRISITKKGIDITAKDSQALRWAEQTLAQLKAKDGSYPEIEINDHPSFALRGFLHDTGRNFIEVDMLIDHLRFLSKYKINLFQWHLTDNPAWRIECKVYPELNDSKFQRKGRDEGRFYTYDQIRQVIDSAQSFGITVMPEIDMPGHSKFFNDTFGFSMDSEQGRKVLEKCLDEFFTEIPKEKCPYFHIGSDEIHIKEPAGFMKWVEGFVSKYDRQMMAWDPGLPASQTTIRQIWNEADGANSGAAQKPGPYVDSFVGYLNYYDPIVYTNRAFLHTPCMREQGDATALGGILCLWNDVNVDDKTRIALHNGMANGVLAFAERFWSGGKVADQSVANLNVLPSPESKPAQRLQAFEQKMAFHRDNIIPELDMRWVKNSTIPWTIEVGGKSIRAWGGAIEMDAICSVYSINSGDTLPATARTRIHVERDTVITAWLGFEAAARSNRISGGIGEQGKWENAGQAKVNGVPIAPPLWQEPGKYKFDFHTWHRPQEEFVYTDEQFYWMREPVKVALRSGWNEIELSCPKTFKGQRWSFAFIPLNVLADGAVREATGVKFE